jgi:hypothetical protein
MRLNLQQQARSPASSTMPVRIVYCSHAVASGAYAVMHAYFPCLMESLRHQAHQVARFPGSERCRDAAGRAPDGARSYAAQPWATAEVPLQPPAITELEAAARQVGLGQHSSFQHHGVRMLLFQIDTLSCMSACGFGAAVHVGGGCTPRPAYLHPTIACRQLLSCA